MTHPKIKHYSSDKIMSEAADFIRERILDILAKYDHPLFLVSGGSSVRLYIEVWKKMDNSKPFFVGLIDERWLPISAEGSNEKQMRDAGLIDLFEKNGGIFFGMVPKAFTPETSPETHAEKMAEKYEKMMNESSYTLLLLGMGPDGHTAGLLPNDLPSLQTKFFENSEYVVYYKLDSKTNPFHQRISITGAAIQKADEVIVFAKGQEKADALTAFMAEKGSLEKSPVRFLKNLSAPVTFLTDISY